MAESWDALSTAKRDTGLRREILAQLRVVNDQLAELTKLVREGGKPPKRWPTAKLRRLGEKEWTHVE